LPNVYPILEITKLVQFHQNTNNWRGVALWEEGEYPNSFGIFLASALSLTGVHMGILSGQL